MADPPVPSEADRASMTHADKGRPFESMIDNWLRGQAASPDPLGQLKAIAADPNKLEQDPAYQAAQGFAGSIMGGLGATLPELVQLANMQRATGFGMKPAEAMQKFGWFDWPGVGKAVSEFSDRGTNFKAAMQNLIAQLQPGGDIRVKAGEGYNHPELLAARYPNLGKMPLHYEYPGSKASYQAADIGSFGTQPGASEPSINVRHNVPEWNDDAYIRAMLAGGVNVLGDMPRETFLHEMGHGVMQTEGMPWGGPIGLDATFQNYYNRASEAASRAIEKRGDLKPSQLREPGNTFADALNREVPFQDQLVEPAFLKGYPHDEPGWSPLGQGWEIATPGQQQQATLNYMKNIRTESRARPEFENLIEMIRKWQNEN